MPPAAASARASATEPARPTPQPLRPSAASTPPTHPETPPRRARGPRRSKSALCRLERAGRRPARRAGSLAEVTDRSGATV